RFVAVSGPSFRAFRANVTSCPTLTPAGAADRVIERSVFPPGAARAGTWTDVITMMQTRTTASFAYSTAMGRVRAMAEPPFLVVSALDFGATDVLDGHRSPGDGSEASTVSGHPSRVADPELPFAQASGVGAARKASVSDLVIPCQEASTRTVTSRARSRGSRDRSTTIAVRAPIARSRSRSPSSRGSRRPHAAA